MKNKWLSRLIVFIIVVLIMGSLPRIAFAQYNYSTKLYTNGTDGELNLRNAPSGGQVIGAYPNGTEVLADVSAKSNNYVPVKIGSTTGWMYYPYMTSTPPSPPSPSYNYSTKLYTNGTDGELNLRNAPSGGQVIGAYPNGTEVLADVSAKSNDYVPVKIGSTTGWMYYPYLTSTPPSPPSPSYNYSTKLYTNGTDGELNIRNAPSGGQVIGAYPNGTEVLADVSAKSKDYVPVKIGSTIGWMYYPYLTSTPPSPPSPSYNYSTKLYTNGTDGELNIRNAPSGGQVIGAYPNGTEVLADVSAKSNNYVPVKIGSATGWMYYPYLTNTQPSPPPPSYNYSTKLYTNGTDGELNIRNAPSGGQVIGAYPNGTEVLADVSAKSNDYVPVKIGSTTGWMYYPYLTNTQPSPPSPSYNYSTKLYTNGTDGELNLRNAPSGGQVIGAYPNGTEVLADVSAKSNDYVPVKIGSTTGWMYYPYLAEPRLEIIGISEPLLVDRSVQLQTIATPSLFVNGRINWSSSNLLVATVDQSGKVSAKAAGFAFIQAVTADGSAEASIGIIVEKESLNTTSIKINEPSVTMSVNDTQSLSYSITPSVLNNKMVTWQSSDPAVVAVDQNGKLTAKRSGEANITVTSYDGKVSEKCKVIVSIATMEKMYVKASTLNVRETPNGRLIGTLKYGQEVNVVEVQDILVGNQRWAKISYNGGYAWVAYGYLLEISKIGNFGIPATGKITWYYRTNSKSHGQLRAVDISNRSGGPIYASESGKIIKARVDSKGLGKVKGSYGYYVMIKHDNGLTTVYAHLSSYCVKEGTRVNKGDIIGYMGTTGNSSGVHLHYEVVGAKIQDIFPVPIIKNQLVTATR